MNDYCVEVRCNKFDAEKVRRFLRHVVVIKTEVGFDIRYSDNEKKYLNAFLHDIEVITDKKLNKITSSSYSLI